MGETTGYVAPTDTTPAIGPRRGNVFARISQPHRGSRTACFNTAEAAIAAAGNNPAHIVLWGWKRVGYEGHPEPFKVVEYSINEEFGHGQQGT